MTEPDEDVSLIKDQSSTEGEPIPTNRDGKDENEQHWKNKGKNEEKEKEKEKKKKKKKKKKCSSNKWNCDDEALWRIYMMSVFDKQRGFKRPDKFITRDSTKLPESISHENFPHHSECCQLNSSGHQNKTNLPQKLNRDDKIRIWRRMRSNTPAMDILNVKVSKTGSDKWPGVWPCIKRKSTEERKQQQQQQLLERIKKQKRIRVLPCDVDKMSETGSKDDDNYADHKELGHARIPSICSKATKYLSVDRAAGENAGLVNGDYILLELMSKKGGKKGKTVHTDMCLRGLKGMHTVELSSKRAREKTWKFCFYQAIIALLAKTQLRYKYAWSVNIDYIYDHAWMLFVHMGYIKLRRKQRLDDVVVYNYKYNIELELVDELKDISLITDDVTWDEFMKKTIKKQHVLERKELMHTLQIIGLEKKSTLKKSPIHKSTREIEDWFDNLNLQHKNCIFRTSRFSLAFWKDDLFWYLYNPFRCNEFGLWDDCGYGCIMKFCSRSSLKRHLIILLLRAYIYEDHFEVTKDQEDDDDDDDEDKNDDDDKNKDEAEEKDKDDEDEDEEKKREEVEEEEEEEKDEIRNVGEGEENFRGVEENVEKEAKTENLKSKKDVFTVQIFEMIYRCCRIHNIKLLQRRAPKSTIKVAPKIKLDACPGGDSIKLIDDYINEEERIEKSSWLETMTITWARFTNSKKRKIQVDGPRKKVMWHQYCIEEEGKLFSLWGQVHIKDQAFPEENRGKQSYACYVVCAGMTRLMAPEYWTPQTLNAILFCGDGYYTSSILEAEAKSQKSELVNIECWNKYLSEYFKIGEFLFKVRILPAICGKLYIKCKKYLWRALEQCFRKYHFGILTCENACLGIFKFCGAYYMFDAHSMGPPIFQNGIGTAYMLRATYFHIFITSLILTIGSKECSHFALNPIEILKIFDLDDIGCPGKNDEKMCKEIDLKTTC